MSRHLPPLPPADVSPYDYEMEGPIEHAWYRRAVLEWGQACYEAGVEQERERCMAVLLKKIELVTTTNTGRRGINAAASFAVGLLDDCHAAIKGIAHE